MHRRFKKYGNIESTEVLKSGKEGYVTFTCDRHACLAYDREKEKCVEVAYTYHQPRKMEPTDQDENEQSIDTDTTSSLLNLNDDCLFAVFNLCDNLSLVNLSETCTRFYTLLTGSYNYPNNKVFDVHTYVGNLGHLMSLALVRQILRLMGSYFQTLDLWLLDMKDDHVIRCLESVMKHCKTNALIRELKLTTDHWNKDYSTLIGPFLKNLEILDFCIMMGNKQIDSLPDLPALCPNLKKINTDVLLLEKCSTTKMPNLESYSYELYSDHLINSPKMLQFFDRNPQIKIFKCGYLRSHDLPSLAVHLPNIQKLSLIVSEVSSSNDFVNLKNFKHLTKLKLSFVQGFTDMPKINLRQTIECFRGFNGLLELKLYFKQKNNHPANVIQQSIIVLSKMLPNLERFDLVGFKLLESTVVNFIRFAGKLKSLHLHICDVYATESLITKLMTVRKSRQDKLKLFLDDEDRNNAVALNGTNNQQYLIVERNCKHDLRWVRNR